MVSLMIAMNGGHSRTLMCALFSSHFQSHLPAGSHCSEVTRLELEGRNLRTESGWPTRRRFRRRGPTTGFCRNGPSTVIAASAPGSLDIHSRGRREEGEDEEGQRTHPFILVVSFFAHFSFVGYPYRCTGTPRMPFNHPRTL
jgi:hypothetical protein